MESVGQSLLAVPIMSSVMLGWGCSSPVPLSSTPRAELTEETSLLDALHAGRLSAGIDCFVDEPLPPNSDWFSAPNLVLTPHIGGTSARPMATILPST